MKLSIEKTKYDRIKITLASAPDKAPMSYTGTAVEIRAIIGLLETALKASEFTFSMEL